MIKYRLSRNSFKRANSDGDTVSFVFTDNLPDQKDLEPIMEDTEVTDDIQENLENIILELEHLVVQNEILQQPEVIQN